MPGGVSTIRHLHVTLRFVNHSGASLIFAPLSFRVADLVSTRSLTSRTFGGRPRQRSDALRRSLPHGDYIMIHPIIFLVNRKIT
jgi:hypothetical protein